jgi:hypothetical protein
LCPIGWIKLWHRMLHPGCGALHREQPAERQLTVNGSG